MAGIQITPSGLAQTGMIACAIAGVVLVIDSIMFMYEVKTLLNYLGLQIYLDERVRAVVLILIGGLAFMFGLGLWTFGVAVIAIATLAFMSYGEIWGAKAWEGTRPTTTVQTKQAQAKQTNNGDTRYRCPLTKDQLEWCDEDHDNNGVLNKNQEDPSNNCKFKSYVTDTKVNNDCKAVQ